MTVCGLEGGSAQVTELFDLLSKRNDFALLRVSDESVEVRGKLALSAGIQETKGFAVLIALVSVEKHQHSLVSQVSLTESLFIETVDLRIGKNVSHTLQINDHHVTLGHLPRKVAQALSNQALVGILPSGVSPASIVVVLVVLALDEVFSIVVFERSRFVQNLVDEGVHELDHVSGVHYTDHLIVEFVDDVLADEHGLDVVLHLLGIVSYRIHILRNLDNIPLFEVLIHHHESIAHGTFSERILSDADERADLTFLKQRLLPVDVNADIFGDEPRMANGVEGPLFFHFKVKLLNVQSN